MRVCPSALTLGVDSALRGLPDYLLKGSLVGAIISAKGITTVFSEAPLRGPSGLFCIGIHVFFSGGSIYLAHSECAEISLYVMSNNPWVAEAQVSHLQ